MKFCPICNTQQYSKFDIHKNWLNSKLSLEEFEKREAETSEQLSFEEKQENKQ